MNEEEIKKTVFLLLKRIAPETDPSQLMPEENIREALNIDSFDALQFIVSISEKLNVDIPEEDYGKTSSLKSLIAYLSKKMNG
jgi:acyl carrier protein